MNYKKSLLAFCLIVCILFSISSVCAGDVDEATMVGEIDDEIVASDIGDATISMDIDDEIVASDIDEEVLVSEETDQLIEETNGEESVSSFDNANDDIASTDNEAIVGAGAGTFTDLQQEIDDAAEGSTIILDKDYNYDSGFNTSGIKINKWVNIDGNGHTLNGLLQSRILYIVTTDKNITLSNIKFVNGSADFGGAIFDDLAVSGSYHQKSCRNLTINNCVFNNNHANGDDGSSDYSGNGGAITTLNVLKMNNCTFKNNQALELGGGIYNGYITICSEAFNITNCTFSNNKALKSGGGMFITTGLNLKNCKFTGNNASYSGGAFDLNTRISLAELNVDNCEFMNNKANEKGGAIYSSVDYLMIKNSIFKGNTAGVNGGAIFNLLIREGTYFGEEYYAKAVKCTFANNKAPTNKDVNLVTTINCTFANTVLSASTVTATYGVSKNLVVTLKDAVGNVLKSKKVTIKVGTISKTLTTNSKGQVSLLVSSLVPKTYKASISFAGDSVYLKSSKTVSVTVKKATPKLTVKARKYRLNVRIKSFTVQLKNNLNKVMKNTKLILRVNGRNFAATTNSKGQATFKITNLRKIGRFTAAVKYAGNGYYNALTKKAVITVVK